MLFRQDLCPGCSRRIGRWKPICKSCGYEYSAAEVDAHTRRWKLKMRVAMFSIVAALVLVGFLNLRKSNVETSRKPAVAPAPAPVVAAAAKEAEDRKKAVACLSSSDGSNPQFVAAVRGRLRLPSSFEHVRTRILPAEEGGQNEIRMGYRFRNRFGGLDQAEAFGSINIDTCQIGSIVTD